jgi:hypothetical protein
MASASPARLSRQPAGDLDVGAGPPRHIGLGVGLEAIVATHIGPIEQHDLGDAFAAQPARRLGDALIAALGQHQGSVTHLGGGGQAFDNVHGLSSQLPEAERRPQLPEAET